jgi:outer membrane protein
MTVIGRLALTAVLVSAPALRASAQSPSPLSLDDALARAVAHAPVLAEARAREAAAAATVRAREALGRPALAATSSFLRTNHVEEFGVPQAGGGIRVIFPDIPSNYRFRTEATVPLYTSGRLGGLVDSAAAEVGAVAADRRALEAELRLEVTRAYWAVVMAREETRVLEQALARADAVLAAVGERVSGGVLPPNEVATARAQRARQQVRLIQARQDLELAQANLGRLVGGDPTARHDPITPIDAPLARVAEIEAAPVATVVEGAAEKRPESEAMRLRQSALRSSGVAARAVTRPQLAALAAVEPARPNPRFVPRTDEWRTSWDLAVQMTWTIWDGGRGRAEAAVAEAQATAIDHRRDQFDEAVAIEIRQRLSDLVAGRAALAASEEAVSASAEAHRVLRERFDAGVATTTDVLDAHLAQLEAELERTRLLAALRLAEARLLRAAGAP